MSKNKKDFSLLKSSLFAFASMFAYNMYEYKKATKNSFLSKQSKLEYTGKFGNISYKVEGEGTPILLIHSVDAGACMEEWSNVANRLSDNHLVYLIDLPGCATSEKTYVEYSAYMYALSINDFIKNVINKDNPSKVTIVSTGTSSGLVATAANLEPDLFSHIVFVNPTNVEYTYCNPFTNPKIMKAIKKVMNLPLIGSFIFNLVYRRGNIRSRLNSKEYSHLSETEKERLTDAMYEAAHTGGFNSKYLLSSIRNDLLNVNIEKLLSCLTVKSTIIAGEDVKAVEKTIACYCRASSNTSLIRVDGVCTPQLEAANRVSEIINNL